ncbi:MAG: hypothetical protein PUC37_07465 [Spirochaetales bacterium]|nr:hypothetical protein [Spirochaetales bacterium]
MKLNKKRFVFLSAVLCSCFFMFAQTADDNSIKASSEEEAFGFETEEDNSESLQEHASIIDDFGSEVFESEAEDSSDDEFDDLANLFNESEDIEDAVTSDADSQNGKITDSDLFKSLTLTGSLNADFGGFANYEFTKDDWDGGGVFLISNTLYLSARASKDLSINGSFTTSLSNKFAIELNTLYFDYLIKDLIFVTAGKRSFSWGYPILFNNGDLFGSGTNTYGLPYVGPSYTNVLEITNNHAVFQMKIPWTSGTFTAMAMYDFDKLTGNVSWKYMSYATSLEFTILNQAINIFARTYAYEETKKEAENVEKPAVISNTESTSESQTNIENVTTETVETESERKERELKDAKFGYWMHPIIGLETKRTILGIDFYGQGQFRLQDFNTVDKRNIDYIIGTGGFYKLIDSFDPNIGIAAEYQYVFDPNMHKESEIHNHKIAVEFGLRRMGRDKNLKLGIDWGHNFSTNNGLVAGAFYISNIFRHGQWKNIIGMSYDKNFTNRKIMFGSIISINMNY